MVSAYEVDQVLRGALSATRSVLRITQESWNEIYCGSMTVVVDGWRITFFIDCGDLDYCDNCVSPDGREHAISSKDAFDPVGRLTPDSHRHLEELLRQI